MWNKKRAGHVKGRHTFSLLSPSTFNVWSWVFWFTTKYFLWWVGVPTKGKPPQPPTTLDMSQLKKPLQTSSEFPATTLPTSHFLGDQQVKTTLLSHQAHGTSRDVPKATLRNTDILYLIYYILLYQFEKTHPKYDMHEYYYISCNTWIIGASWLMIPPPPSILTFYPVAELFRCSFIQYPIGFFFPKLTWKWTTCRWMMSLVFQMFVIFSTSRDS